MAQVVQWCNVETEFKSLIIFRSFSMTNQTGILGCSFVTGYLQHRRRFLWTPSSLNDLWALCRNFSWLPVYVKFQQKTESYFPVTEALPKPAVMSCLCPVSKEPDFSVICSNRQTSSSWLHRQLASFLVLLLFLEVILKWGQGLCHPNLRLGTQEILRLRQFCVSSILSFRRMINFCLQLRNITLEQQNEVTLSSGLCLVRHNRGTEDRQTPK